MTDTTEQLDDGRQTPPSLTALVSLIMEQVSLGAANPLDLLCAEHPQQAQDLRARVRRLEALGMLGGQAQEGPATVGPFTIVGKLGQGGMGDVYLGQQSAPVRRMAAVKVMRGVADAGLLTRRFEAERQALATLNHPGISQVLEAGEDDKGQPWFAMEYVDGAAITDYADSHKLDLGERIELFLQVCDAVAHAHQNGILHRDIKPGNVMVTERGGLPLAKVIDFGLAKATEASALDASMLTQTGQLLGTPAYMSPEQAGAIPGQIGPRTDVYALGVLLYVLLVGQVPLTPKDEDVHPMLQMQRLLREESIVRPSQQVAQMPGAAADQRGESHASWVKSLTGDLDWIVTRALAARQADRYPAVTDLAADLRRHLRHEVVLAGPPSTGYRVARFLERHRREAITAAVALTVGLVLLIVGTVKYLSDQDTQLGNFDVLEREIRLGELLREADEDLWPAEPRVIPAMKAWRDEMLAMVAASDGFRDTLAEVQSRGTQTAGLWQFEQPRDRALHASVLRLLDRLAAAEADDGPLAAVEARMTWATDIVSLSLDQPAEAWAAALADIADREACPAYDGLVLAPQLGLVPLARNEATGLWEFAFLQQGAILPKWAGDRWAIEAETCLVFVLVPGGTVQQGAQSDDPEGANYFYSPAKAEHDGHLVTLDPFFISKYELSQEQYERVMGNNPSGSRLTAHPVEQLDWVLSAEVTTRSGLTLPTGAQWEYAARSNNPSPWWTGPADGGVPEDCGNLADRRYLLDQGAEAAAKQIDRDYDDGRVGNTLVDAHRPNAFGLHNVIGNVWEWCRDPAQHYANVTPRPGDGLQELVSGEFGTTEPHELRGGSSRSSFSVSRSTYRHYQPKNSSNVVYGVRPCRPVRPPHLGEKK